MDARLILERTISLKNVSGRIDHLDIDVRGKRAFIAELGNGSVDIIDLQADKGAAILRRGQNIAFRTGSGPTVRCSAS
jgi:hypothetical protein